MARKKIPVGETPEELTIRKARESLIAVPSRPDKATWDRRMNEMVRLLSEINPIEDQIVELIAKKQPHMDAVAVLRKEMVDTCVHPETHLVAKTDTVTSQQFLECKFCMRKFTFPNLVFTNAGI